MPEVRNLGSSDEIRSFVEQYPKTVIMFGSDMCGHCRTMKPEFRNMSDKYGGIKFGFVDTQKVRVSGITGIPVFILYFRDHKPTKVVGADKNSLEQKLQKLNNGR